MEREEVDDLREAEPVDQVPDGAADDGPHQVGFTGWLNQSHDQDQLESSAPIQPELRAIDGFARVPLRAE